MARPTVAEIDLNAILHNLKALRSLTKPDVSVIAVVKGDGYGHGAVEVGRVLASAGVRRFAVAMLEEAIILRDAHVPGDILIMGASSPDDAAEIVRHGFEPVVSDMSFAHALDREARAQRRRVSVHLKFDTGMGRIGFPAANALDFAKQAAALPGIGIVGAMTHFPSADDPAEDDFTRHQIAEFGRIRQSLRASGIEIPLWHAANSAGVLAYPESHFNAIRPGLALYGNYPAPAMNRPVALKQAITFRTRIAQVRPMPEGATVSYGRTFRTERPSRIAVLPLGYADGYSRLLSNRGHVLIRGRRVPVVGRVCMDLTMADVTGLPDARPGDEVVLYGRQGDEMISIEEIAQSTDAVPQVVMTALSARVPRRYVHER